MILPAVIPRSPEHLKETLEKVSFAGAVQIDVVDGKFDDDISWPYEPEGKAEQVAGLIDGLSVEIDLMVKDPVVAGREWLQAGAKALVFHIESLKDPKEALVLRPDHNFRLGWSLGNDTPIESLYPLVEEGDFVQLMGIAEIGAQGQPFDARVLERIATVRALYPDLIISIDGGVTEETILEMKKAGADRFVVGSTILRSADPEQTYEHLLKITSS